MKRGLLNPRGSVPPVDFAKQKLSNEVGRKFKAWKTMLQKEDIMTKMSALPSKKQARINKFIDRQIADAEAANDGSTAARWKWLKVERQAQGLDEMADSEFTKGFYHWMAGRGSEKDHKKTPWGREPHAMELEEVREVFKGFIDALVDTEVYLQKLIWKGPQTQREYFIYYKYVLNGDKYMREDDPWFFTEFKDLLDTALPMDDYGPNVPPHPQPKHLETVKGGLDNFEPAIPVYNDQKFDPATSAHYRNTLPFEERQNRLEALQKINTGQGKREANPATEEEINAYRQYKEELAKREEANKRARQAAAEAARQQAENERKQREEEKQKRKEEEEKQRKAAEEQRRKEEEERLKKLQEENKQDDAEAQQLRAQLEALQEQFAQMDAKMKEINEQRLDYRKKLGESLKEQRRLRVIVDDERHQKEEMQRKGNEQLGVLTGNIEELKYHLSHKQKELEQEQQQRAATIKAAENALKKKDQESKEMVEDVTRRARAMHEAHVHNLDLHLQQERFGFNAQIEDLMQQMNFQKLGFEQAYQQLQIQKDIDQQAYEYQIQQLGEEVHNHWMVATQKKSEFEQLLQHYNEALDEHDADYQDLYDKLYRAYAEIETERFAVNEQMEAYENMVFDERTGAYEALTKQEREHQAQLRAIHQNIQAYHQVMADQLRQARANAQRAGAPNDPGQGPPPPPGPGGPPQLPPSGPPLLEGPKGPVFGGRIVKAEPKQEDKDISPPNTPYATEGEGEENQMDFEELQPRPKAAKPAKKKTKPREQTAKPKAPGTGRSGKRSKKRRQQ